MTGRGEIRTIQSRTPRALDVPSAERMVERVPEVLDRHNISVERRDPRAATQNLRYISPGRATPPDWNAEQAFELAYYMSIVVYACVRLRANVISRLPFRVGADPTKPQDYDATAPLAQLLGPPPGGPAPKLSARRLWAWTVAQRMVTGRNGWEIERNGDAIAALWPLASSALVPVKSSGGAAWFAGFVYGRSGEEKNLTNEQVVYDWSPSGTDFREPESDLRAANLDIAVSIMQSRYDYAFLKNDARPPAIIVTEEFEDEDSFEAFKRQWNSNHGGVDNAGRAAFLEATGGGDQGVKGAVDVTVLGISPKDAQAAQRHTAAMERTAIGLGTPWSLLDASGRTYSNAGQEWTNFATLQVVPMVMDFQDMVNMQLAPLLGNNVGWFDLSSLGIDEESAPLDANGAAVLYNAKLITKDEARAPFGLPPTDGGDEFATETAMPLALAAAAQPGEERKMHDYKGDGGDCAVCGKPPVHQAHGYFLPRAANIEVREPAPKAALPGPPVPALEPASTQRSPEEIEARRAKLWTSTNGRVKALERSWERALRKLFARQARSAVARLEGKRGRALVRSAEVRATADEVFDPAHWLSETIDDVTALYESVVAAGGQRVSDLFGLAFDLEAQWAQDFIAARANQLAGQVTETTYTAIQDALREGTSEGEAIPDLAARIKHVFSVATDSRATTIARTETISAFNGSAALTATNYGSDVVAGQEWIATRDSRTRDDHAARDGEIVAIGELFSGGLAYPGDPSGDAADTVNCRCTVAFLTPDDMDGQGRSRTVETRVALVVLRMVKRGSEDVENGIRAALKAAA